MHIRRGTRTSAKGIKIGIGDEILAAGQAKRAQLTDPRRVQILDRNGLARWHPIWEGNQRIVRPGEIGDFQTITNGSGARPYIDSKTSQQWTWKPFDCTPGEIFLTADERAFAEPYRPQVVIEPTIKAKASPNKQWGNGRWRDFARRATAAGYALAQLGPPGTPVLPGATLIVTLDFRRACAVLANASAYVGPDGGLHHAAAALGVPAVVIRGAFISQECTGYASHRNLFTGTGLGCGMRVQCSCCLAAMAAISPEMVLDALRSF